MHELGFFLQEDMSREHEYGTLLSPSWLHYSAIAVVVLAFIIRRVLGHYCRRVAEKKDDARAFPADPVSVNFHFTRQCNYQCGFCFHTAKTSFVLPLLEAKHGLKMLKEAGI